MYTDCSCFVASYYFVLSCVCCLCMCYVLFDKDIDLFYILLFNDRYWICETCMYVTELSSPRRWSAVDWNLNDSCLTVVIPGNSWHAALSASHCMLQTHDICCYRVKGTFSSESSAFNNYASAMRKKGVLVQSMNSHNGITHLEWQHSINPGRHQ
jgi:hypothetical protein